jgi:hypothetical protein
MNLYNTGNASFGSVQEILAVIRAAHTRVTRHPEILLKKQAEKLTHQREHVFIIHGRDEAKWRELKDIIEKTSVFIQLYSLSSRTLEGPL